MGAESLTVLRWFCSAVGRSKNLGGWEAQKSRRSFEWKGIAFGTYKIRSEGVGACPWFQGGTGSVLRVSKVAARRRRQLWRSGDGGVG